MPLTLYPASHPARPVSAAHISPEVLFQDSCSKEYEKSKCVLQTSFKNLPPGGHDVIVADGDPVILSSNNGFVRAAWDAYAHHHHLRIRPEDVWFAILTQFSFYVNAHSEELSAHFVAHEGRKQLQISAHGSIKTVDMGKMALAMTEEIHKNIVDPDLRDWIMPDFTTTDKTQDSITAAVIMMGTMQRYFAYRFSLATCGIPSVTMLGEREDWVKLRRRVDKLATFGKATEKWASLLIPVLDFFVQSWDEPTSDEVMGFWASIADYSRGSGFSALTGWITAFCFFGEDGTTRYHRDGQDIQVRSFAGTVFPRVDPQKGQIPDAFVSVPVELIEVGGGGKMTQRLATRMVAGSVGLHVTSSGGFLDESHSHGEKRARHRRVNGVTIPREVEVQVGDRIGRDTLQPLTGWWMYELKKEHEAEAKQVEAPQGVRGYDSSRFLA